MDTDNEIFVIVDETEIRFTPITLQVFHGFCWQVDGGWL